MVDDDNYRSSRSDRRRSRSRSRSRSPPRRRRDRSYSPAARRRSPDLEYDTKRERSPRRERDADMDYKPRGDRAASSAAGGAGREVAAAEAAKRSVRENRVYVGNLSFQVRWNDLKDFMREAGNVVFAEVMTLPNGMSKGCGVVEYSTREEAQKAISSLNEQSLLGRQLFIREDREEEARYGAAAVSGRPGGDDYGRGGFRGGRGGGRGAFGAFGSGRPEPAFSSKQLIVGGLNWEVGWQDLKDLFRQAGDIIRADIHYGTDGNPKGTGMVVFANAADAVNAISMFDGAELNGMKLEVKEERFSAPQSGPFGGGRGGFAPRGAFAPRGRGGYGGSTIGQTASPSNQIFVKNLPWSTSNEDLVELFQTTGTVEYAEALSEGGRSKGCGIVQFNSNEEAETAIAKFQGYSYGGRPLALEYNARYRDFIAQPIGAEATPSGPSAGRHDAQTGGWGDEAM